MSTMAIRYYPGASPVGRYMGANPSWLVKDRFDVIPVAPGMYDCSCHRHWTPERGSECIHVKAVQEWRQQNKA